MYEHSQDSQVDREDPGGNGVKPPNICTIYLEAHKLPNLDLASKSDPFARVYIRELKNKSWAFVGETEVVENNLDPRWNTSMKVNYYFEKKQIMKIEVFDDEGVGEDPTLIGICETTLASIMAARNSEYKGTLMKGDQELPKCKIIVKAESVGDSNNEIEMLM